MVAAMTLRRDLHDVKQGDPLCIPNAQDDLRIVYVKSVTKTRVRTERGEYNKDGSVYGHRGSPYHAQPATMQDVEDWETAKHRRTDEDARQKEYEAREDVQLARRLSRVDVDQWLALGVDRMHKIIVAILEANS